MSHWSPSLSLSPGSVHKGRVLPHSYPGEPLFFAKRRVTRQYAPDGLTSCSITKPFSASERARAMSP